MELSVYEHTAVLIMCDCGGCIRSYDEEWKKLKRFDETGRVKDRASLCYNIYSKATGLDSRGGSDSSDQTASGKTENLRTSMRRQEYPLLLTQVRTPALATVYSWIILVMKHLAALYRVSTVNEVDAA
ncbi:hypothetical protein J6590_074166 [Homalodisca vitripennis]|nr:hypothetical protein J6590_097183 [Homalodisca vitripennis]KAG8270928.1 hypothetical protein J6590_074166 [Homalodisca vitripennis]